MVSQVLPFYCTAVAGFGAAYAVRMWTVAVNLTLLPTLLLVSLVYALVSESINEGLLSSPRRGQCRR